MQERLEATVVDWARRISVVQIPAVLAFLTARLLAESHVGNNPDRNGDSAPESTKLLTAGELATSLNVPESWVRTEERAGRIPGIRLGKYIRFRLSDVERVLAERKHQSP